MRFYGLDLRVEFDRIGCRRLWVYLTGLPRDAAWREQLDWSITDELLATIAEQTNLVARGAGRWKRPLRPLVIPRPHKRDESPVERDPRKIAAFFGQFKPQQSKRKSTKKERG